MSADGFPDSTQAAEDKAKSAPEPIERIGYLSGYSAVFANPNWPANLLMGGLGLLIPVIGTIVIRGYEYETIETLHRRRATIYPDFDFNDFVPYLTRGVWPWLVSLVVSFILQLVIHIPLTLFFYAVVFGIAAVASADETAGIVTAAIVIPLIFILIFAMTMAILMILTPMLLRAGLSQDFGQAFRVGWIRDFIRRVWLEIILIDLFLGITGVIVIMTGMALFFVGMIPAAMLMRLASCHLHFQLYELYLARGGEPIPLKEEPQALPPIRAEVVYPEVIPEAES